MLFWSLLIRSEIQFYQASHPVLHMAFESMFSFQHTLRNNKRHSFMKHEPEDDFLEVTPFDNHIAMFHISHIQCVEIVLRHVKLRI